MKAGLRSIVYPEAGGVLHVDLVVDDGPAMDETGFTPWDRATYTSGFSTFTEVELDARPEIPYGGLRVSAGSLVLPSRTALQYAADEAATARAWFDTHSGELARGNVYARVYTVETDTRDLDWFGRVTARGLRKPITEATRTAGFSVDASCGLGPALNDLPSEPTTDVPVGSLLARAMCRANPHNTLRINLDPYASNQHQDGSSRYSALHLRASTEWAGPAFVAEGLADTPDDADGDYGNVDAILDAIARNGGLRVFLSASSGEWMAVPATALGEAMAKAEKVICAAAIDGGPAWSFEAIAADTWTPTDPTDIDDGSDHGFDVADRLSAVTLDTGGASLVRQPFPVAPVPSVAEADLPSDAIAIQQLVAVAAEPNRRVFLEVFFVGYEVPPTSGTFEYPGAIRLYNVGFDGTTQWLASGGTWETAEQTLGAPLSTSSVLVSLSSEDFHAAGKLHIALVGDSTTGVTGTGSLGHADLTSATVKIKDELGQTVTSWRVIIGESDLPGDVEAYTGGPTMEADTDGAGTWAAVTGWASQRWGSGQTVWAEYAAEAELRRRANPMDSFDGVANDLLGPEARLLLPAATDMDAAGTDSTSAYVVGAGLVIRTNTMDTRGLWFRLPAEAL